MKIVLISDTHTKLSRIDLPEGDLLIQAGDHTFRGTVPEVAAWAYDTQQKGFKYNVAIAGNHDWLFQDEPGIAKQICEENGITYLEDEMVEIEGLKIWGSPWQPEFCGWAFNLPRGEELKKRWDLIPNGIDILVTHGPPYGYLDTVLHGYGGGERHVGCEELQKRVLELKPKLHVFGHVHGGYGEDFFDDIHFVNASSCNEKYMPVNKPIVIDWL